MYSITIQFESWVQIDAWLQVHKELRIYLCFASVKDDDIIDCIYIRRVWR